MAIPGGSGQYKGTLQLVGYVHGGTPGGCSTGPHIHIEMSSIHNYGSENEWHSPQGPDGYPGLDNHNHCVKKKTDGTATICWRDYLVYQSPDSADTIDVNQGIGTIGGDANAFWMRDNPYTADH